MVLQGNVEIFTGFPNPLHTPKVDGCHAAVFLKETPAFPPNNYRTSGFAKFLRQ